MCNYKGCEKYFIQLLTFEVQYGIIVIVIQMVQVNGNLKVKLPPLKTATSCSSDHELEFVQPSVVGFIGECHRVDSGCSAMDVVLPLTSFSWTKTLDKKLISVDPTYVSSG